MRKFSLTLAVLLGIGAILNGLFMLWSPPDWYFAVPGVTTTGPFNQHFVRDIGLIFMLVGAAFLVGAAKPQYRVALWITPTVWLWGHALFHVWEVVVGICGTSALARDFPAVTLPALLGSVIAVWAIREARFKPGA